MRNRELGYIYSSKLRLVNPDGETAGEIGMGPTDDMAAVTGSQKGRKPK